MGRESYKRTEREVGYEEKRGTRKKKSQGVRVQNGGGRGNGRQAVKTERNYNKNKLNDTH